MVVNYASNQASADEVATGSAAAEWAATSRFRGAMSRADDDARLFDEAEREFGRPTIVVNSAGTSVFKPHAEVTEEEFDRLFGLNARGTFFVLQQAARRVADGGRIIYVTASASPGSGMYIGSKAPGEQFVVALSRELGSRGVTVNTVSSGLTETDGLVAPRAMLEQLVGMTALGRLGKPDDIAAVVAFLAGPDAGWITGHKPARDRRARLTGRSGRVGPRPLRETTRHGHRPCAPHPGAQGFATRLPAAPELLRGWPRRAENPRARAPRRRCRAARRPRTAPEASQRLP